METENIADDILAEKLLNIKNLNKLYIKTNDKKIRELISELFAYFSLTYDMIYKQWKENYKPLIRKLLKLKKFDEFKFLYNNFNVKQYDNYIVHYAVKYNFTAVVKFLIENGYTDYNKIFNYAVKYDNLEVTEYVYQFDKTYIDQIGINAVKYNITNIAVWAIKHGADPGKMAELAVVNNNIQMLQEIGNLTYYDTYKLAKTAIEVNNIDAFKILMSRGIEHYSNLAEYAAVYGRLTILELIPEDQYNTSTVVATAAEYGHLNIIEWFYKNGYKNVSNIALSAAKNGHNDIIKWATKRGFNDFYKLAIIGAKNGYIKIVEYAYENGADNVEEILNSAALNDHPDIVSWAIAHGAKDIENVKHIARVYGYNDL